MPEDLYSQALNLMKEETPDYNFVASLLVKASQQRYAPALYAIGTWYLHGFHFKRNIRTGTKYLIQAAKLGHASACFDLAVSYEKGIGVKKDVEKAFELYLESYFRGDESAKLEVTRCIWYGIGIRTNRKLAGAAALYFNIKEYKPNEN